jgi:hypothetical protein
MTTTEIPADNGVNVEALLGMHDALEIAMFQWRSTVSWHSPQQNGSPAKNLEDPLPRE